MANELSTAVWLDILLKHGGGTRHHRTRESRTSSLHQTLTPNRLISK